MKFTNMDLDDVAFMNPQWAAVEDRPKYLFGGHRVGDEWEGLLGYPQGVLARFPGLAVRVINAQYSRRKVPPHPLFGSDITEFNRMVELLFQSPKFNDGEYGWRWLDVSIPTEIRRVGTAAVARFLFTVNPKLTYAMAQHVPEEILAETVDVRLHFPMKLHEGMQVH
jgi:hypothetical protein